MTDENSDISYEKVGRFAVVPHSFIENSKHLSVHARWLFVALMFYRNSKSGLAFPSYDKLCELTGMSRNRVSKSIRELEDEEQEWVWLTRNKRPGFSTRYRLHLPPSEEPPF